MNYDAMIKEGRITALKEFFKQNGKELNDHYAEWFYEKFLGICMNLGYLWSTRKDLNESPYAEVALKIYEIAH